MEMAKREMKKRKSSREGGDFNFPYIISRILNFGPVVFFGFFLKVVELVFMGSLLWVDVMRMMKNGDG